MKHALFLIGALLVFAFAILSGFFWLYRSTSIFPSQLEPYRTKLDIVFTRAYNTNNPIVRFANTWLLGNGDKYAFRPARPVPAFTMKGKKSYKLFALVNSWDPAARLLAVSTYTGKHITVRFDPDTDGSMAYVPRLNSQGALVTSRAEDFVRSTSVENFPALFCTGDVIALFVANINDQLFVPLEIRLSQRVCSQ